MIQVQSRQNASRAYAGILFFAFVLGSVCCRAAILPDLTRFLPPEPQLYDLLSAALCIAAFSVLGPLLVPAVFFFLGCSACLSSWELRSESGFPFWLLALYPALFCAGSLSIRCSLSLLRSVFRAPARDRSLPSRLAFTVLLCLCSLILSHVMIKP